MPIEGLSTLRRLPEAGRIALGIKKRNPGGTEYPQKVDYFILHPNVASEVEKERVRNIFHKLYGDEPKSIDVMFPVADLEIVFPQSLMRFKQQSGLQCRGDGKTAVCTSKGAAEGLELIEGNGAGLLVVRCDGQDCPYYQDKACRRVATLKFLLPSLPGIGVWKLTTGSFNSIRNLNSCLDYITALAGRFHMIPLKLLRREQEIIYEDDEGRHKSKYHALHLDMDISLEQLQALAQIDPGKIMLSQPAVEKPRAMEQDVHAVSEREPEAETHETPPPAAQCTYKSTMLKLAEIYEVDPAELAAFGSQEFPTEAMAFLAFKAAVGDEGVARTTLQRTFLDWVDGQGDTQAEVHQNENGEQKDNADEAPAQEMDSSITEEKMESIKGLAAALFETHDSQKFRDWRAGVIGSRKGLHDLTKQESGTVISALQAKLDAEVEKDPSAALF